MILVANKYLTKTLTNSYEAEQESYQGIRELFKQNDKSGIQHVMKVAAFFHAVFENIHPFANGNGRVGRTLLNYYLITHEFPPLVVYDEDKALYYQCLENTIQNKNFVEQKHGFSFMKISTNIAEKAVSLIF